MVPIPRLPVEGMKTKALEPVVEIPTELTPTLEANIGYTGVDVNGWETTWVPVTPVSWEPSPK